MEFYEWIDRCGNLSIHEGKRCGVDKERRAKAAKVVKVLQGMHAESGEGLNVGVPVMKAVDVLVHGGDVDKSESIIVIKISLAR